LNASIARAFVAIAPPERVLDAVGEAVSRVAVPDGWRWTPREQWHLTLLFLGAVADADAVVRALRGVCRGRSTFPLALGGAGAFPRARRAGVVWVGVDQGAEPLVSLADAVGEALAPIGHERDEARFHPHLTVARTRGRDQRDARALVAAMGDGRVGDPWTVDEVLLYESHTRPSGAEHAVVERFPLSG
jgi:2'-5' RNA ligase